MRLLVTGGCGFIGSAVCRRLIGNGHRVVNLDLLTYASDVRSVSAIESSSRYEFVRGDIQDAVLVGDLLRKHEPEAIVHLAAESHVDRSIDGPRAFVETNILGTFTLLQQVRRWLDTAGTNTRDRFRFLHVSTDEVFCDLASDEPAFTETSPYRPSSPYSASKAASDHLVRSWRRTYGLPAIVTNCSNNYGPYQFPEKLIPLMILTALAGGDLPVYGDGLNVRDWLHVEDHAEALERIMLGAEKGEDFNIGGSSERRNIDVVHAICDELDRQCPKDAGSYRGQITFVNDRLGHDRRYAIDGTKLSRELGWQANRNFEQGLASTVTWYLNNKVWWQPHFKRRAA